MANFTLLCAGLLKNGVVQQLDEYALKRSLWNVIPITFISIAVSKRYNNKYSGKYALLNGHVHVRVYIVCVHVCVWVYIVRVRVCVCIHCACAYICVCVHVCVYIVCVHVCVCVYIVHMHVCAYIVHMHVCVCIHCVCACVCVYGVRVCMVCVVALSSSFTYFFQRIITVKTLTSLLILDNKSHPC